MSIAYTEKTLLAQGLVTTPSDGDIVGYIGAVTDCLVLAVVVTIGTAGAQAASALTLQVGPGGSTIHSLTMGTTAAYTVLQEGVAAASQEVSAGTTIEIVHDTADASAIYGFQVYGTCPWS